MYDVNTWKIGSLTGFARKTILQATCGIHALLSFRQPCFILAHI